MTAERLAYRFHRCCWAALILTAALLLLLACGCAVQIRQESYRQVTLSKDIAGGAGAWAAAFTSRYHRVPFVVDVHGSDRDGRFVLCPDDEQRYDADSYLAGMRAVLGKNQPILLVSCNTGHCPLHTPGVCYALRSVWSYPGCDKRLSLDDFGWDDAAGGLDEFVWSGEYPQRR